MSQLFVSLTFMFNCHKAKQYILLFSHNDKLTIADGLFENLVSAKKMLIQKKLGVLRVKVNKEK